MTVKNFFPCFVRKTDRRFAPLFTTFANEPPFLNLPLGNHTPGSRVATGCNSLVMQARINLHVTRGSCSVDQVSNANSVQKEDKNLLQRSQLCQHGKFRQVSVSGRQRSHLYGQNLCGAFVRAVLSTNVKESIRAMAANGTTKMIIPPPPR